MASFRVTKDFTDNNPMPVEVSISCNNGLPLKQSALILDPDGGGTISSGPVDAGAAANPGQPTTAFSSVTFVVTNFTVTKDWFFHNLVGDYVEEVATVTIYCSNEIDDDDAYFDGYEWSLSDVLYGDGASLTATVDTTTGSTTCYASESLVQSGVETEDNCGSRTITAGGSSSCTITNTVFFEGIPTLNRYGMAIMALLMLALGMVGFRRFA